MRYYYPPFLLTYFFSFATRSISQNWNVLKKEINQAASFDIFIRQSTGRLDTGKIDISYDACALRSLISSCCERQSTIAKTHSFVLDIDGLPECIDADPRSLAQVFTNLLSNAVKYAPGTSEIRVTAWEETGNVKVSISDDGVGIDPEDVPRLFQRYFRAGTSTGIAGTGIGLNLVKQIVELHHGSIEVRSAKGCGSTFTVTLPIKRTGNASENSDAA